MTQAFLAEEQELFDTEVQEVQKWWQSSRFNRVTRPYTAGDGRSSGRTTLRPTIFNNVNTPAILVIQKRGTLKQSYPSDQMAKKLWSLLEAHQAQKTASFTYGALDPVQVTQMAKYLETVYVSGWQCSSTASTSNEPGPDLADYPMVRCLKRPARAIEEDLHLGKSGAGCMWEHCSMICEACHGAYVWMWFGEGRMGFKTILSPRHLQVAKEHVDTALRRIHWTLTHVGDNLSMSWHL